MYELLLVLIRHPDRILEKEFLLQSIWPDSFVEEGNISFNIRQLRKALGDDAQTPSYIETIPRRGYRFLATVDEFVTEERLTGESVPRRDVKARLDGVKPLSVLAVSAAAVLFAGLTFAIWFFSSGGVKAAPILLAPFALERLSTDGQVHLAAISRDGKMVVYSRRNAGKQSLWLMQPGASENSQIVPLSDFLYYGLAISPDGKFVYYSRGQGSSQRQPDIYRESIFGGVPQRVVSEAQGWISLSPDGEKISFVRCPYTDQEYCSLWIADSIDGRNERKLVSRPRPIRIADNQISPDGKTIAFAVGESRTYSNDFGLSEVDIDSAAERDLTSEKFFNIEHLAWLPDAQGLLLTARREPDKNFRIWHVSTATGVASSLTDDSQTYSALSLNNDASVLVTSQVAPDFHLNLYRSSDPTSGPRRLADALTVNFAPNGELVFSSRRTGNQEIWSIKSDGSGERQLTNNPSDDVAPIVSPDNDFIFFASNRTGKIQIWKINRDGSNQTQVTFQQGGNPLVVSRDGQWLYYKSALEKKFMRVSIPDGHEEMVFDRSSQDSVLAPSGERVALSERINGENLLNVVSLPDGAVVKTYRYADSTATPVCLGWSHDDKYLAYILTDQSGLEQTLWFQPLDGQRPRKVVDLHEEVFEGSGLALSPDDESFAVVQGMWSHDAVLIRGLK